MIFPDVRMHYLKLYENLSVLKNTEEIIVFPGFFGYTKLVFYVHLIVVVPILQVQSWLPLSWG